MKKSKLARACDVSPKVKREVAERDTGHCIICGQKGSPNAHYISRANLGKGIPENIVTLCDKCHYRLDQTTERENLLAVVKGYLNVYYPNFTDEQRKYHKGEI